MIQCSASTEYQQQVEQRGGSIVVIMVINYSEPRAKTRVLDLGNTGPITIGRNNKQQSSMASTEENV